MGKPVPKDSLKCRIIFSKIYDISKPSKMGKNDVVLLNKNI
jgi:hypothetical protein